MSDEIDLDRIVLCLSMASQLPCDPRHRMTLEQSKDAIESLRTRILELEEEIDRSKYATKDGNTDVYKRRLEDKINSLNKSGTIEDGQLALQMQEVLSGEQRFMTEDGSIYVREEVVIDVNGKPRSYDLLEPVVPIYSV